MLQPQELKKTSADHLWRYALVPQVALGWGLRIWERFRIGGVPFLWCNSIFLYPKIQAYQKFEHFVDPRVILGYTGHYWANITQYHDVNSYHITWKFEMRPVEVQDGKLSQFRQFAMEIALRHDLFRKKPEKSPQFGSREASFFEDRWAAPPGRTACNWSTTGVNSSHQMGPHSCVGCFINP